MIEGGVPIYLYILRLRNGRYYVGITKNLERRLEQHEKGIGSNYVYRNQPFKLVYYEEVPDKIARKRELEVKKMSRKEKEMLIYKWQLKG